jgi:CRISPR-associated endoribonuclease Cas6
MLGPYLQGIVFEKIASSYASALHDLPFNPYSQYCFLDRQSGALVWQVNTLTDEAAEQIIKPLQTIGSINIKKKDIKLQVAQTSLKTIALKQLTDLIYSCEQTKTSIQILTPISFKSAGNYIHIPNLRLLFQNLIMRYGQAYSGSNEVDQQTIDYIGEHARMTSYSLRSAYYENISTSGIKIPAFIGSMTISVKGPQPMTGLAHMLLQFAEYAGIGIKTSMGMGGVLCLTGKQAEASVGASKGTEEIIG